MFYISMFLNNLKVLVAVFLCKSGRIPLLIHLYMGFFCNLQGFITDLVTLFVMDLLLISS